MVPYVKMDKNASVKVEIRSLQARKLIDKTLKLADQPGKRSITKSLSLSLSRNLPVSI